MLEGGPGPGMLGKASDTMPSPWEHCLRSPKIAGVEPLGLGEGVRSEGAGRVGTGSGGLIPHSFAHLHFLLLHHLGQQAGQGPRRERSRGLWHQGCTFLPKAPLHLLIQSPD